MGQKVEKRKKERKMCGMIFVHVGLIPIYFMCVRGGFRSTRDVKSSFALSTVLTN